VKLRPVCALLGVCIATGCVTRVAEFSVIANRQVEFELSERGRRVEAEVCTRMVLFVPLEHFATLGEVFDLALAQVPPDEGNTLVDVSFYNDALVTLFWNRTCLRVRGTAARLE
jgi:hypothetical protein